MNRGSQSEMIGGSLGQKPETFRLHYTDIQVWAAWVWFAAHF